MLTKSNYHSAINTFGVWFEIFGTPPIRTPYNPVKANIN